MAALVREVNDYGAQNGCRAARPINSPLPDNRFQQLAFTRHASVGAFTVTYIFTRAEISDRWWSSKQNLLKEHFAFRSNETIYLHKTQAATTPNTMARPLKPTVPYSREPNALSRADYNLIAKHSPDAIKQMQDHATHLKYGEEGEPGIKPGYACIDYRHTSKASVPTCSKTCHVCSTQDWPLQWQDEYPNSMTYYKKFTDDEAAKVVRDLVEETQKNLDHVRERLNAYGDTILKRWRDNRNKAQRVQVMLDVMPKISHQKWFQATLKEEMKRIKPKDFKLSTHRTSWLLPYVILDILKEDPMLLLAMLHHRSHHHPSEWVTLDDHQLRLPFEEGFVKAFFNPHCVVMHSEHFGNLVQWNKSAAHRLEMIGFPRAQLILESQNKLSCFLRGVADKILGGTLTHVPKGKSIWQGLVAIGFHDDKYGVAQPTYYLRAYLPPPRLDIAQIIKVSKARRDATEDELVLLQADPMYALEKLEILKNAHSYVNLTSRSKRHSRLVDAMTSDIIRLDNWQELIEIGGLVKQTMEEHEGQLHLGKAFPKDYDVLLRLLGEQLKRMYVDSMVAALELSQVSRMFEDWVRWDNEGKCQLKVKVEEIWRKDKLFWNLQFIRPHDSRLGCDQSFYLGFIDDLLSNSSEKARVDQQLCGVISDLTAIDEALAAIRYERPRVYEPVDPRKALELRLHFPTVNQWNALSTTSVLWQDADYVTRLWKPLKAFMKTPPPSSRIGRSSLLHLQNSHNALSGFWEDVRAFRKEMLTKWPCPRNLFVISMLPIAVHLTKAYERDCQNERNALLKAIEMKGKFMGTHLAYTY